MTADGDASTGTARPDASCPACGTKTAASRTLEPGIGGPSMDELETLTRNEWRRRLGEEAYRRPHRRTFVRSLLVCTLKPEEWEQVRDLEGSLL